MAYMKPIFTACSYTAGCKVRASKVVYTRRNDLVGQYCASHAKRSLSDQKAIEAENDLLIRKHPDLKRALA